MRQQIKTAHPFHLFPYDSYSYDAFDFDLVSPRSARFVLKKRMNEVKKECVWWWIQHTPRQRSLG